MNQHNLLKQAIASYLFQTNNSIVKKTTLKIMQDHSCLLDAFVEKFSPESNQTVKLKEAEEKLKSLKAEEKEYFKRVLNFINCTLRTSYFQDLEDRISFKIDVPNITDSSQYIKSKYEIFVFSENVEGSHLRTSKVARGGIRWSSLKDRYRFEVLQLVASQYLKNAIIVPDGAKGCFYIKEDLSKYEAEEKNQRVIENYKTFIKGLLDVTDNIVDGKIISPKNTKIFDDNDPYLVVAADKGTARFSDIANEVANSYNFWLKDAFASGGKHGYDHKEMGITAKGAWQVANHHLSIAGIDVAKNEIKTVGVGDMSGDVFGNGMLEHKTIKLIAAFNHKHIFIDPNPESLEKSYNERLRLYENALDWGSYDKSLISQGGGVFSRSCDEITLSAEIQEILDLKESKVCANTLIKSILKANVDLLWFGGIGTYILSSSEDNEANADKANKDVRVRGNEIRAKVVGEGANLGATTKARHEMNNQNVLGCGDIIDNSCGVFASDKEVNIKIVLDIARQKGLLDFDQRNKMLESLKDEVASRILYSNYQQALIVSIEQEIKHDEKAYDVFFNTLAKELSFSKEDAIYTQDDKPYTKSELSLLLLCSKLILKKMISENTAILEDESYLHYAYDYFPTLIREKYKDIIENDFPLKDSIVSMMLANKIANHYGIAFIFKFLPNYSLENIISTLFAIEYSFNISKLFKEKDCNTDKKELYKNHINIINKVEALLNKLLAEGKNQSFAKQCEFIKQNGYAL